MKLPRLPKMPKFRMPRPRKKLDARVRTANPPMIDDYDADEPQTKLSSAFIVVLLLHVVAVGGIYAFNSIKSSRKDKESLSAPASGSTALKQPAAPAPASVPDNTAATRPTAAPAPALAASPSLPKHYVVKKDDTLTSIAKNAGISVTELEAANGLKPTSTLLVNQSLIIPAKGTVKPAPETAKAATAPKKTDGATPVAPTRTYTVKDGDRLLFIAKRFNVRPDELIAVNKIKDPDKLQSGQMLKIPTKKAN